MSQITYNSFNNQSGNTMKTTINNSMDNKLDSKNKRLNINAAYDIKSYPSTIKEWSNSVYSYNKQYTSTIKVKDTFSSNLIRNYFYSYNKLLENNINNINMSRRYAHKRNKYSINKIITSQSELKHTNDKVIITIYVYNAEKNCYINVINDLVTIDRSDRLNYDLHNRQIDTIKSISTYVNKILYNTNHSTRKQDLTKLNLLSLYYYKNNFNNSNNYIKNYVAVKSLKNETNNLNLTLGLLNNKYSNVLDNKKLSSKKYVMNNCYNILAKYLNDYLYINYNKEIVSIYNKQLLAFNKSKFSNKYLSVLKNQVKKIYNKNVEFNFINLKYLHMDSFILSSVLASKIKNKANNYRHVLGMPTLMFDVPTSFGQKIYNQKYNRNTIDQGLKLRNISSYGIATENIYNYISSPNMISSVKNNINKLYKFMYNLNKKYVKGLRLELSGRITYRNTAARSGYLLKYKGNVRNSYSSDLGLPSTILRGNSKSNVQYSALKSKKRIGSFGLKVWVSGN